MLRYYAKAFNLAVCYAGFCPDSSLKRSIKLGTASFVCAAYDVVTDWREFDPFLFTVLAGIMDDCQLSSKAIFLTTRLHLLEVEGRVGDNGLERGQIAMDFISEVAGLAESLGTDDEMNRLGWFSQIIDDILDLEEDLANHEQNALLSSKRDHYLDAALKFPWSDYRSKLPHSIVLNSVISSALAKARKLRCVASASPEPDNSDQSPHRQIAYEAAPEVAANISYHP